MAAQLIPVSPPVPVSVLGTGVESVPGLLVALRWAADTDVTDAAVLTRHRGLIWADAGHVEASAI
jgi:hypothetical protein